MVVTLNKVRSDHHVVSLLSYSFSFVADLVYWLGAANYLRRVDADEMWTQTVSALHNSLRSPNAEGESSRGSFVDDYLSADLQQTYVMTVDLVLASRPARATRYEPRHDRLPYSAYCLAWQADLR